MDLQHKIIRELLRKKTKPEAESILNYLLPSCEAESIYYVDIEKLTRMQAGERLGFSESTIRNKRRSGYEKLAASFFEQK